MKLKKIRIKSWPLRIAAIVLVAGAVLLAFEVTGTTDFIGSSQPGNAGTRTELGEDGINYNPPTDEEKQQADDNKQRLEDRINQENQSQSSSKQKVVPVVTTAQQNAGMIRVTAYISGIFEDGGTCTMKATKGSLIVTATTKAFANATTTDCSPFNISRSEFPQSGNWSVVVSYSSPKAEGVSESKTLMVN